MFVNLVTLSFTFLALAAGETLRTESKVSDPNKCPKTFTFYEVAIEGTDIWTNSGSAGVSPLISQYIDRTYKTVASTTPNGNFLGTCTHYAGSLIGDNDSTDYCTGTYNIDQFYDKVTHTTTATGPCPGSISYTGPYTDIPLVNSVSGGTGKYVGASGTLTVTTIPGGTGGCPPDAGASVCYKITVTLQ